MIGVEGGRDADADWPAGGRGEGARRAGGGGVGSDGREG